MSTERPREGQRSSFMALRLSQYLALFISSVLISRALGPGGRGQYALALALASNVWIVSHLTLEGAAGRLLGRREATFVELSRFCALAVLVFGPVGFAITVVIGLPLSEQLLGSARPLTIILAAGTVPFLLANQLGSYMLLLDGELRLYGAVALASSLVQLAAVAVVLVLGHVTPTVATATTLLGTATMGLSMMAAIAHHRGLSAVMPHSTRRLTRRMLLTGISLHPLAIAFQLEARIDLLLVGALTGRRDAGLYSIALTVADSSFLLSQTFAQAGMRAQTDAPAEEAVEFTISFARQCGQLGVVSAALSAALAYPFIRFVYGAAWTGSVVPLILLLVATVAIAFEAPIRFVVARIGQPLALSALAILTLLINVGVTVPLIELLGVAGAAIGTIVAYWCFLAGNLWLLKRRSPNVSLGQLAERPHPDDRLVIVLKARWRRNRARSVR